MFKKQKSIHPIQLISYYRGMTIKKKMYEVIFEADTPAGKAFDVGLLFFISASIVIVLLESMSSVSKEYGHYLQIAEWIITIIFTAEYFLRLWVVNRPMGYALSFFGVVDLVAILPQYLGLIFGTGQALAIVRALRLLRIFRVLKFTRYTKESNVLITALLASRHKIFVFLFTVLTLVLIIGSIMYLVEGEEHGFTSIPNSIYWAIVTMTTVGYGDLTPQTDLGKVISSFVMVIGYGIIAVPTGIVSHELSKTSKVLSNTQVCSRCLKDDHQDGAHYCSQCGEALHG